MLDGVAVVQDEFVQTSRHLRFDALSLEGCVNWIVLRGSASHPHRVYPMWYS